MPRIDKALRRDEQRRKEAPRNRKVSGPAIRSAHQRTRAILARYA